MPQTMTTTIPTTTTRCKGAAGRAAANSSRATPMKQHSADHHRNAAVAAAAGSSVGRSADRSNNNNNTRATKETAKTTTTTTTTLKTTPAAQQREWCGGRSVTAGEGGLRAGQGGQGGGGGRGGVFILLDSKLIRIAMVALLTSVIFDNTVYAAQRETLQLKHTSNSITNDNVVSNDPDNDINVTSATPRPGGGSNAHSADNQLQWLSTASSQPAANSTTTTATTTAGSNAATLATTATATATATTTTTATTSRSSSSSSTSSGATTAQPATTKSKAGGGGGAFSSGSLLKAVSDSKSQSNMNRNTIEFAPDADARNNGPYFDKAASKNVTALLGKTAYLNCRVRNLGNRTMLLQVSWVRHRDVHLLTVGRYTYTSDQRFRAIHQPQTEDWMLQIKYPQHRDSGIYECQVSTTPHMSHYIHLTVVEPSTEIMGAPDLYIESGSTINLTCVIQNSPEPPAYIYWNHNNAIINYDSPRGGVTVITNKGPTTTSFLLIKSAKPSDSGQYQCNPSNAKSKSVTVHVLNGKYPAAIQRAAPTRHLQPHLISLCAALSLCYSVWASLARCCSA